MTDTVRIIDPLTCPHCGADQLENVRPQCATFGSDTCDRCYKRFYWVLATTRHIRFSSRKNVPGARSVTTKRKASDG